MTYKRGHNRKGTLLSKEHRESLSRAKKGKPVPWLTGPMNRNWKGGVSKDKAHKALVLRRNCHLRRARLKNACGAWTVEQWEALKACTHHACACCHRKEPDIKLTPDHIVPLSRGGRNDIGNIQPLCLQCNQKKNTRTVYYMPEDIATMLWTPPYRRGDVSVGSLNL